MILACTDAGKLMKESFKQAHYKRAEKVYSTNNFVKL